jgi:hypothetical protein
MPLAEGEIFYHTPSNTSTADGKVTESLMADIVDSDFTLSAPFA